ncbi:MAG: glutamine-hydrolyzing GMP synthase [Candidatus Saelkia tenebricola]|nr:glutamine-hydrolyzing GMP synthase [Candidatus Saelkia tenebricola]
MEKVFILDFGSQYTQLIARKVREAKVLSEIVPFNISVEEIKKHAPLGIILSGGPASVIGKKVPLPDTEIFKLGIPILGICYGMQAMAKLLGGVVDNSLKREYGRVKVFVDKEDHLFKDIPLEFICWMSHSDQVSKLPLGFKKIAHTKNSKIAAMADFKHRIYGVQFHPEVIHTQFGKKILNNFLKKICLSRGEWRISSFVNDSLVNIRQEVGENKVVLGLSGGVDSSVVAVLLHRAISEKLHCVFVDNGLLRKGEPEKIKAIFDKRLRMNIHYINAEHRFISKLKNVIDPEKKRKIIGEEFVNVFQETAKKIGDIKYLAQGTLYPDVVESLSAFGGPSAIIKTHHNVGGLPKKMKLKLVEPLRFLFKDEVRKIGKYLGLTEEMVYRHPFPGPGLAVRIIGEVTKTRLNILKEADAIIIEEIKKHGFYRKVWQAFAVLLPVKSVGVMGDERTYENVLAVRIVKSVDGMTADWVKMPHHIIELISNRIINEVRGVNRVVYDISSKPPATIEWE